MVNCRREDRDCEGLREEPAGEDDGAKTSAASADRAAFGTVGADGRVTRRRQHR